MLKSTKFLAGFAVALSAVTTVLPAMAQVETADLDSKVTETAEAELPPENPADWQYQTSLNLPADNSKVTSELLDVFISPDIFRQARYDLSDLRLNASDGTSIPFAVRTLAERTVQEYQAASEFNRSEPDEGVHELTLEISGDDPAHNQVVVETSGEEFRRTVVIEGSDDGKDWKKLVESHLLHLKVDVEPLIRNTFRYRESRHRFLRIQVTPDPQKSTSNSERDEFTIASASATRQITIPAVTVVTEAVISSREPTRQYGSPGSRWILDFGAEIPVDRLEVSIKDQVFARDISLEAESVNLLGQRAFYPLMFNESATWQRQKSDEPKDFSVTFSEVRARRLRLVVADYRNKPLTLTSVQGSAPARQIVLPRPEAAHFPLTLRFGNPEAESPNYDFARNLPEVLPSTPVRGVLGTAEPNPAYVAPPKPFTERYPWFIYVALSSVSIALGAVVMNLSRAAITNHDAAGRKS